MLPISPAVYRVMGWTRRTKMGSVLLMELFPLRYFQFEQSFSYTPAIVRIARSHCACVGPLFCSTPVTRWGPFLNGTYLPVAILPAPIAFPKYCKRKHRTSLPF